MPLSPTILTLPCDVNHIKKRRKRNTAGSPQTINGGGENRVSKDFVDGPGQICRRFLPGSTVSGDVSDYNCGTLVGNVVIDREEHGSASNDDCSYQRVSSAGHGRSQTKRLNGTLTSRSSADGASVSVGFKHSFVADCADTVNADARTFKGINYGTLAAP